MGCNKLFVTIHKNGFSNVSATAQQVREAGFSWFEYNVLAMHLRTIIRHAIDARHFRNGSLALDESMLAAAKEIKRDIDLTLADLLVTSDKTTQGTSMQYSTAFGPSSLAHGSISLYDRVLLHIDGGPSLAKGIEHQKRLKKREEAASKLDSCIRAFNIKRGRSRRVPKKLLDRMQRKCPRRSNLQFIIRKHFTGLSKWSASGHISATVKPTHVWPKHAWSMHPMHRDFRDPRVLLIYRGFQPLLKERWL